MRTSAYILCLALAALLLSSPVAAADRDFFLADGRETMFWGNSITDYGVYPRLIENYVLTHHPDMQMKFVNLGWGGDQVRNLGRLRRDIQHSTPDRVTVMLGMNDAGYRPFDRELLNIYLDSMRAAVDIMQARSEPEIMLIAPTLYELRCVPHLVRGRVSEDDFARMRSLRYPEALSRFTHELGLLAGNLGLPFFDLNYASRRVSEEMDGFDGNFMYTAESVHPTVDGQLHMGLAILEAMGADFLVAETEIDIGAGRATVERDCAINQLDVSGDVISFNRLAEHLPLPVHPATTELMRRVMDYPDAWDRDILRVVNLRPGWYRLSIDGRGIDVLSSEELAGGINLSRYPYTPQMVQSYRLYQQTEIRNQAFYTRWRGVLLEGVGSPRDFTPFRTGVNTDSLQTAERAAFRRQHEFNQPALHTYKLERFDHPGYFQPAEVHLAAELDDMVRIRFTVDSRTLRSFEPPLTVRGNFAYSPDYRWGLIEAKSYYANVPVELYDDGSHGDERAGDGVWSLEMHVRRGSGQLRFALFDGRFRKGHWNYLHPEWFRNENCRAVTSAWAALRGGEGDEVRGIALEGDVELNWDRNMMQRAVELGLLYAPGSVRRREGN